ncbi:MAG: glycine zipper 2TM domain-containing protein [Phenylobacterium sp.]|uniref:glycine zipper 2TM domain-containing protein n=1 Tax=Phenylobacterium sp. TaxID=1871053 RepID=UPI001208A03A|nr:glycine zipper 2TM domain-containing protein [Phenylobacterium sp.]TAJ74734.1 MAG: glycine zipper 2TM domain-containing protein [Phenylobacterium sp.]
MHKHLLVAGIAAAALLPSFALAQQSCEQRRSQQAVGTIAGAGIGALLGSAIAGKGDRTAGAVVGGLGGGVIGNQLAKPGVDCAHAYGYYDNAGAWHASTVSRQDARGYFDRQGEWVEGAPNGHYDSSGRWTVANTDASAAGYYDGRGRWVPASANGYYAADGRWVAGAASGHYDTRGRWIAGPATGSYDANGRWMPGRAARASDLQPGYYDNGQWRRGEVTGYYDARGRWITVEATNNGRHANAPTDIAGRQAWLDERIRRGLNDGTLTRSEGDRALRTLAAIGREERSLRRRSGDLRERDRTMILAKLDTLSDDVREMRRGPVRQY